MDFTSDQLTRDDFSCDALDTTDRPMIIGGDLDALLAASLLHEYRGHDILGFYTGFEELWYPSDRADELTDAVYVDLDIYDDRVDAIGHHIVRSRQQDSLSQFDETYCNPNEIRGVYKQNFGQKYPLGTTHLLLWYYDITPNFGKTQRALLMAADSAWINAQAHNYRDNVADWINTFEHETLQTALQDVTTSEFETIMEETIYPMFNNAGFVQGSSSGTTISKHGNSGWQCTFRNPTRDAVQNIFDMIEDMLGWESPTVPSMERQQTGNRQRISYSNMLDEYGSLDGLLNEEHVFSYALPSYNTVNYTTDIYLQQFDIQ